MDLKRPLSRKKNVTTVTDNVIRGDKVPKTDASENSSLKTGTGVSRRAAVGGGISLPLIAVVIFFIIKSLSPDNNANQNPNGNIINSDYSNQYSSVQYTEVDTSVALEAREKRTEIIGDGQDQVTVMVYMCGTDLESESGMATADIQEMAEARFGDNVNLLIYAGGCTNWKISGISNKVNQIIQIRQGIISCLEENMGDESMTDPKTLTSFIKYCEKNFPANRNDLVFWDHGGGSVSGYGYDQRHKSSSSMTLSGINKALKDSGVKFDFIGFDACLMATAETALMLSEYSDYMIASEETEPGIGWYYKTWLTKLGKNSSLSTLDVGKYIVDDFISTCDQKCHGQKTTLSVIDLAEFSATVPPALTEFSKSISEKLSKHEYQDVSDARYMTREFAKGSRIDQVDLVNLSDNMKTEEGKHLSDVVKSAVKYNRTSSNLTGAYGVSIFFPYQSTATVDKACRTYDEIGMNAEYGTCIRQFASLETSGQIAAGGSSSPLSSLLGNGLLSGIPESAASINELLTGFIGGISDREISGLDKSNIEFLGSSPLVEDQTAKYIASNSFEPENLVWSNKNGRYVMTLPETQWVLIHTLDKNMFLDDGEGFINLGLDNVYMFDADGNLIADTESTWLTINDQVVSYYHTDTIENGEEYTISGLVPVLLNGTRADLLVVFDNDNPNGYVAGASYNYSQGETDTIAKSFTEIKTGDRIDFICEYYSYDGEYLDDYFLGEQITVTEALRVTDTLISDANVKISYCFTDIYNQKYWTESITK